MSKAALREIEKQHGGVNETKIDSDHLRRYLRDHDIEITGNEKDPELLAIYHRYVAARIKGSDEAGICDQCNSRVIIGEELCPVCVSAADEEDDTELAKGTGSVKDLDASVRQIKAAAVTTSVSYWRLGKAILDVYQTRLYKRRLGENNKPKYKSFKEFCNAELPFTDRHANRLMTIAVAFDEQTVREIGSKKLYLIAKCEEGDRVEMVAKARSLSMRQLEGEIKKLFPEVRRQPIVNDGATRRIPPGTRAPKAPPRDPGVSSTPEPVPTPKESRVTAVVEPGEVVLKLKSSRSGKLSCKEDGLNGVVTEYTIDPSAKTLTIKRTRAS